MERKMVQITFKSDPQRAGIFVMEEIEYLPTFGQLRIAMRPHIWRPPTDVFETEEAVIVRVEIAGMKESDFQIVLDGRLLSIRGVRSDTPERRAYYQMEIRFGEFSTEVELPCEVQPQGAEATYNNGFLRVLLPKVRPKKIHVEE
jgi:HSP20 family protein